MATVVHEELPIPDPPEGHEWKYALMGEELYKSVEGKDLLKRLEERDIMVEVKLGAGFQMQLQPEIPVAAKVRAFKPDEGIIKP